MEEVMIPQAGNSKLVTTDPDSPPVLKKWRYLYLFVLGELALLVLLFYALSRFYQ